MKKNIYTPLFVYFLFVLPVLAQDPPAVHGMVVMGEHQIYASHLPMFHSPHDYQVILEIDFAPAGKKIYLEAYKASTTKFFTIEPEKFVLPQMIRKPHNFRVNIYEGHFEKGGKQIAQQVEVRIKKVIYSKKLNDKMGLKNLHFILFGNQKEQFAAHLITVSPDFDQIFRVKFDISLLADKQNYADALFPDIPNSVYKKEDIKALCKQKKIEITRFKEIYLEYDDLE